MRNKMYKVTLRCCIPPSMYTRYSNENGILQDETIVFEEYYKFNDTNIGFFTTRHPDTCTCRVNNVPYAINMKRKEMIDVMFFIGYKTYKIFMVKVCTLDTIFGYKYIIIGDSINFHTKVSNRTKQNIPKIVVLKAYLRKMLN